jgi:hypothetical protein
MCLHDYLYLFVIGFGALLRMSDRTLAAVRPPSFSHLSVASSSSLIAAPSLLAGSAFNCCRALGQFFLGLACFPVHFGIEFLKLSFEALDFARALGFMIVGQPTEILFDGADNLPGFAFDF